MSHIHIHTVAGLTPVHFVTGSSLNTVLSKHGAPLQSQVELWPHIQNSWIGQEGKLLTILPHTTFVECGISLRNCTLEGISLASVMRVVGAIDSARFKSNRATASAIATTDCLNRSIWVWNEFDQCWLADAKVGIQHSCQAWL